MPSKRGLGGRFSPKGLMPGVRVTVKEDRAKYFFFKYGGFDTVMAIGGIVRRTGDTMVSEAITAMNRSTPGPSSPGEAPARRTGKLIRSMDSRLKLTPLGATATVGPTVDYGRYLEKGTRRMEARPYLQPALSKVNDQFYRNLMEAVARMN